MLFRKINIRISLHRKKDLLKFIDFVVIVIHFCKRCLFIDKTCILNKILKKCVFCIKSNKLCDLVVSSSKLRRIYKKRLCVRDAIYKIETKLHYLRSQLRRLKDKKKKTISSK